MVFDPWRGGIGRFLRRLMLCFMNRLAVDNMFMGWCWFLYSFLRFCYFQNGLIGEAPSGSPVHAQLTSGGEGGGLSSSTACPVLVWGVRTLPWALTTPTELGKVLTRLGPHKPPTFWDFVFCCFSFLEGQEMIIRSLYGSVCSALSF